MKTLKEIFRDFMKSKPEDHVKYFEGAERTKNEFAKGFTRLVKCLEGIEGELKKLNVKPKNTKNNKV